MPSVSGLQISRIRGGRDKENEIFFIWKKKAKQKCVFNFIANNFQD